MATTPNLVFTNPATGQQFGQVSMASTEQANQAVREMRTAFKVWSIKPVEERASILTKFQELLIDYLDEITSVLNQDCGKSRQDALLEVFMTVDMLRVYVKHAPAWLRRVEVSSGLYIFKHCYVEPRPYGVVAVIAPWNYPLALSLPPVLAALLAGNTVILKPSEVTGATGVLLERLFQSLPELAPFVRVLHGDASVGATLVTAAPDYIFLTGSTITGKRVMATSSDNLVPVACELGGKDAMIVLEDANLDEAAHWGVWGAFFNTGQTCMAVERVYVVESVYDAFVQKAIDYTLQLKVGYSPEKDSPYYLGPITDPRQVRLIDRQLTDALEKGARILIGGNRSGMFIEPTILVDVNHTMQLMQDETFGPLMPIMKVRDEVEAIRMANDNHFGLGASIWSNNLERAQRVAHQVEASTVIVNDTIAQFAIPMLPFGGIKQSGNGRTHGKEGLMQFTRPFSYVISQPPLPFDLTTIARKPGNYDLISAILHLVFGVNPRQRLKPLGKFLERSQVRVGGRRLTLGLGLGLAAGAITGALLLKRRKI